MWARELLLPMLVDVLRVCWVSPTVHWSFIVFFVENCWLIFLPGICFFHVLPYWFSCTPNTFHARLCVRERLRTCRRKIFPSFLRLVLCCSPTLHDSQAGHFWLNMFMVLMGSWWVPDGFLRVADQSHSWIFMIHDSWSFVPHAHGAFQYLLRNCWIICSMIVRCLSSGGPRGP